MRYLAIFELIFFSLGLCGYGLYLFLAEPDESSQTSMMKAINNGQINASSLVVADKYQTAGKNSLSYVILSNGITDSDIVRQITKRVYSKINVGDNYVGYDLGGDYLIPAFESTPGDTWKLYTGIITMFAAFTFVLAAYKIYKRGKLKDMAGFQFRHTIGSV